MAVYGNMVITQQGQTLYGKVQSGVALTFTRMQIGSGQLATTLTAALTSGTAYTSLAVQALTSPVASGDTITIGTGGTTQTVTASAAAAIGATTIDVNSFTANAAYAIGATVTTVADPSTLTALLSPIGYFAINAITQTSGTANVMGIYQNTALAASTYTCEIGLFAQDPTLGEILYAYANAGAQGDTFPAYADGPFSRQFQVNTAVGNATSVTATIPAGTYIPVSAEGAANGVATLDANGHVPATQLVNAVLATEAGAASGVATLDSTGNVPSSQLGNVPSVGNATTAAPGLVEISAAPLSGPPVAVSTTDGAYTAVHGGTYVTPGTGLTSTSGTNGQTLNMSAAPNSALSGPLVMSIGAGAGISVTNPSGVGSATVTNTGVTSLTAGSGINLSGSSGGVTITNSSPNTSASGVWTPASGSLNVAAGTVINVAAVPDGATVYFASAIGAQYGIFNRGVSTSAGTAFEYGSAQNWSLGISSTSLYYTGADYGYIMDGSYQAGGYFQIDGGYLQFVVLAVGTTTDQATTVRWGVS